MRAHWSEAILSLLTDLSKYAEEEKHCSFSSVEGKQTDAVFAMWIKIGLSRQLPSLPEQPRYVIDLCFCFTSAIPKKGEVLENSGRLRGDQSVCVSLYTAAVCADGWAWFVWSVFLFVFPPAKQEERYTIAGYIAACEVLS